MEHVLPLFKQCVLACARVAQQGQNFPMGGWINLRQKNLLISSFSLLALFFIIFLVTSFSTHAATPAPADHCAATMSEMKTCVGIGLTVDKAITNGNTQCSTKCTNAQTAWCAIRCSASDCTCTKGNIRVQCTVTDSSCIVYTADGDIDPKRTTGNPCVVDCKTGCDALCSGSRKESSRSNRNE